MWQKEVEVGLSTMVFKLYPMLNQVRRGRHMMVMVVVVVVVIFRCDQ